MSKLKKLIMMANQRVDNEPLLPKEYVQLEHLEFTGTQWIDTRITPILSDEIEFECIIKQHSTKFWAIFGSGAQDILWGFVGSSFLVNAFGGFYKYFESGSARETSDIPQSTDNLNIINCKNDGYFYVNDVQYFKNPYAFHDVALDTPLYIGTRGNLTMTFTGVIGKFKLTDKNGKLKLNLIPVLRVVDSKPGMYDLVTGQFFVNQGTGEFVFEMPYIPDTIKPYLCFEAVEDDFQAKYSINPCEYSIDDRKTWNELPADTLTPPINAGKKIYFRGRGEKSASIPYSRGTFSTTKLFNISGNMLSMIHGSDFLTGKNDQYSYSWMFKNNKNIVSISENLLNVPVSFRDFYGIFENSSIRNVDIHRFNNGVYYYAFKNSTLEKVNITSSSSLPTQCFTDSFSGTQIQELDVPCKSIQYAGLMIAANSCKYLTKVIIRATSIAYNESNTAYSSYFQSSFQNCSALNSVIFLVANIPLSKRISNNWLTGVAEEGTIILNKNIIWNPEDYRNGNIDNVEGSVTLGETITWGIPAGWEIKYCDPDNIDDVRNEKW